MIDKIEAYYEGGLSPEEMKEFEAELKINAELVKEVELYKKMKLAITQEAMKETLEGIHNETFGRQSDLDSNGKRRKKWILVLLPVIIGGLAFIIMWNKGVEPDSQEERIEPVQFYAQSMPSLDGLPVTLSEGDDLSFREGMIAYRKKDFPSALEYFNKLYSSAELNDTVAIYLANTFIALENYTSADELLDYLLEQEESNYYEDALYYSVKTNLLINNLDKALLRASSLLEQSDSYDGEMSKIIEFIDNN